jgi:glucose/arabinose dehydrogenase
MAANATDEKPASIARKDACRNARRPKSFGNSLKNQSNMWLQRVNARRRSAWLLLTALALWLAAGGSLAGDLSKIALPPGFHIEQFAQLDNAREMALGGVHDGRGVIYVGSFEAGNVYALEFQNDKVIARHLIAHGLNTPLGVAWHDDTLYVSEVSRVVKYPHIDEQLEHPPAPVTVTDHLPSETHHGGRFLAISKDGWLYVPVGMPCNVCKKDDTQYGVLKRMRLDGSDQQLLARGIRNTVGFDFSPVDGSVWFTDNGRDMMGDEIPSDKLNHLTAVDQHFGFPYCDQGDIADPEFGSEHACREFIAPVVKLGPHVATLGMRFYTGDMFPPEYRNNIFIAEHGSWNRSKKIGYRVARVSFKPDGSVASSDVFASGWLQVDIEGRETVSGRPADVLVMPDGALLVSDDTGNAIYRISYRKP